MRPAPSPPPDALTEPFWEGARAGELRLQRCGACEHVRFPPSPVCPRCLHEQAEWVATSGEGEILTYVVFHRAYQSGWEERVPYGVLLVQLDDGPRLFSDYSGNLDELAVGRRVRVTFAPMEGDWALPVFAVTP